MEISTELRNKYYQNENLIELVDEAVVAHYDLHPSEVRTLAALLLEGGLVSPAKAAHRIKPVTFDVCLENLVIKGVLYKETDGVSVNFAPLERHTQVQDELDQLYELDGIPTPKVVFRSLLGQLEALALSDNNSVKAASRVYAFVFGMRPSSFPVLGKLVKALGPRRTARFFLEHALDEFTKDPLMELLPQALWLAEAIENNGVRPESAPDEKEQREEREAFTEQGWERRMRFWLEAGSEQHALANNDQARAFSEISETQHQVNERQIKLDFAQYKRRGEPQL